MTEEDVSKEEAIVENEEEVSEAPAEEAKPEAPEEEAKEVTAEKPAEEEVKEEEKDAQLMDEALAEEEEKKESHAEPGKFSKKLQTAIKMIEEKKFGKGMGMLKTLATSMTGAKLADEGVKTSFADVASKADNIKDETVRQILSSAKEEIESKTTEISGLKAEVSRLTAFEERAKKATLRVHAKAVENLVQKKLSLGLPKEQVEAEKPIYAKLSLADLKTMSANLEPKKEKTEKQSLKGVESANAAKEIFDSETKQALAALGVDVKEVEKEMR